ncbi:MAG: hypothetical protein HUJ80_07000, partial [Firmicutes bacterium]|nr:hypothetical protein [Bacillota bacterium]
MATISLLIDQLNSERRKKEKALGILCLVSLFVAASVFWQLRFVGITMTDAPCCGLEEHVHTEECIAERVLVCGLAEGDVQQAELPAAPDEDTADRAPALFAGGSSTESPEPVCICDKQEHAHGDGCYDEAQVLNCADDHHTEGCYSEEQVLTCENTDEDHLHEDSCYTHSSVLTCSEMHDHPESCYQAVQILNCTEEEHAHEDGCYEAAEATAEESAEEPADPAEGEVPAAEPVEEEPAPQPHVHTDECYEQVYGCGCAEHTHTDACFVSTDADTETEDDWEATLPALTGNRSEDLVNIAKSQVGYTESVDNVKYSKDGSARGYTRYGEWYGHPYGDNWSSMFVSFCLYYADIPAEEAPANSGCETMREEWEAKGLLEDADLYRPQEGDLVFFDKDGNGLADSVGIITRMKTNSFIAVEGNVEDSVQETVYTLGDESVMGFGRLPQKVAEKQNTEAAATSSDTFGSSWFDEDSFINPAKSDFEEPLMLFGLRDEMMTMSFGDELMTMAAGDVDLEQYINSVSGSGTVKQGERYSTLLEIDFSVPPTTMANTVTSGSKFTYRLPSKISLISDLLNTPYNAYKIGSNPLQLAFVYTFVDNHDGTFGIEIEFDSDYASDALNSGANIIDNALRFRCYIDGDDDENKDGLQINFSDVLVLDIPSSQIAVDYDISTEKTGALVVGDKLRYEVTVSTEKGTPGPIDIADTFTYAGDGTVTAPATATVTKKLAGGATQSVAATASFTPKPGTQNSYDMTMTLPQLAAGESYTVVYEYAVGNVDEDSNISATNSVEAQSSDGSHTTSDMAESQIYRQQPKTFGKQGSVYEDAVQWHIAVNNAGKNIAGKVVYDQGFADALSESIAGFSGIQITRNWWPEAEYGIDYEYVFNSSNEIIGIRFLATDNGTNTTTYNIKYHTRPDTAYGETITVHNEAQFDGESSGFDVGYTGGGFTKRSDGHATNGSNYDITWTVSVDIPALGIAPGTQFSDTFAPSDHYMTAAQWAALQTALETAWGSGNVTDLTPTYAAGDNTKITGYSFTIAGSANIMANGRINTVTWNYETTGEMNGAENKTFDNTFSDGVKSLTAQDSVSAAVKKMNVGITRIEHSQWWIEEKTEFKETPRDIALDYNDETQDKTFVWVVKVLPNPGTLAYNITDTLPEGVELLGVKVRDGLTTNNYTAADSETYYNADVNSDGTINATVPGWGNQTQISGSVQTVNGHDVVDLTLSPANGASAQILSNPDGFYIVYYCQLKESAWPNNGMTRLGLNNNVTVTADGSDYGQASNTINIDATRLRDVVEKSGAWDKDTHLISYTVDINPTADNLLVDPTGLTDPDTLQFTDILTYTAISGTGSGQALLNLNSVKLEKEVANGVWIELSNVPWKAHTELDMTDPNNPNPNIRHAYIEMDVPDSTHLRLTYSYNISSSMTGGITLSNAAMIEGHGSDSGEDQTHVDEADFATSGESTFPEYRLVKVDQDDGTPLPGAEFTVYSYQWVGGNPEFRWLPIGKTYTTDAEGKIVITANDRLEDNTYAYQKDVAYCLIETKAPTGYLLPEDPPMHYFWFSNNNSTRPGNLPA